MQLLYGAPHLFCNILDRHVVCRVVFVGSPLGNGLFYLFPANEFILWIIGCQIHFIIVYWRFVVISKDLVIRPFDADGRMYNAQLFVIIDESYDKTYIVYGVDDDEKYTKPAIACQ